MRLFSCFGVSNSSQEQNGAVVSYPVQKQDQVVQSDLVNRIYQGPDCSTNVFVCGSLPQCGRVYGRSSVWSLSSSSQNLSEPPRGSQAGKEKPSECLEDFEDNDGLSCLIVPAFPAPQLMHPPEAAVPLWAWNSDQAQTPRFSRGSQQWGVSSRDMSSRSRDVSCCRCCRKQTCKHCKEMCLKDRPLNSLPGSPDDASSPVISSVPVKSLSCSTLQKPLPDKSLDVPEVCCACYCAVALGNKCTDTSKDSQFQHCFKQKRGSVDLPESLGDSVSVIASSIHGLCCCRSGSARMSPSNSSTCHSVGHSGSRSHYTAAPSSSSKTVNDERILRGSFIAPMMPSTLMSPYHRKSRPESLKSRLFSSGPTIVTTIVPLGPQSTHMVCPHCRSEVDTATKTSPSRMAWIASLLLCLICPLGCCLIPFCMDGCMNTDHTCPNCKTYLGQHSSN